MSAAKTSAGRDAEEDGRGLGLGEHPADLLEPVLHLEPGQRHEAGDQAARKREGAQARFIGLLGGHLPSILASEIGRARFREPMPLGYPSPPMAKRRTSGIQRRSRASDEAMTRRVGQRARALARLAPPLDRRRSCCSAS